MSRIHQKVETLQYLGNMDDSFLGCLFFPYERPKFIIVHNTFCAQVGGQFTRVKRLH